MSADEELGSRRFRLYDETAPFLVRAGDPTAGQAERLDAGRKAAVRLREWPAYLTPETLAALSDLESGLDDAARLAVAATVLHARLAEALRSAVWTEPALSLRLESAHRERMSLQEDLPRGRSCWDIYVTAVTHDYARRSPHASTDVFIRAL